VTELRYNADGSIQTINPLLPKKGAAH